MSFDTGHTSDLQFETMRAQHLMHPACLLEKAKRSAVVAASAAPGKTEAVSGGTQSKEGFITPGSSKFAFFRMFEDMLSIPPEEDEDSNLGTALDLGAGAGYSTKVLSELDGITRIDAVDPSGDMWRRCGYASALDGVRFHQVTDEAFFKAHERKKYDVINISYGVSTSKAEGIAAQHLKDGGVMLAPVGGGSCLAYYEKKASGKVEKVAEDCSYDRWNRKIVPDFTEGIRDGRNTRLTRTGA